MGFHWASKKEQSSHHDDGLQRMQTQIADYLRYAA
jgi:hypothetical protein